MQRRYRIIILGLLFGAGDTARRPSLCSAVWARSGWRLWATSRLLPPSGIFSSSRLPAASRVLSPPAFFPRGPFFVGGVWVAPPVATWAYPAYPYYPGYYPIRIHRIPIPTSCFSLQRI